MDFVKQEMIFFCRNYSQMVKSNIFVQKKKIGFYFLAEIANFKLVRVKTHNFQITVVPYLPRSVLILDHKMQLIQIAVF